MREMVALDDNAATESPTSKVTMTVAVDPTMEVARISTTAASALMVVSSAHPTSSAASHASSSLCLEKDVVVDGR
jgi:hypothetical protein